MLIRTGGNNDGNKHLDWLAGLVKVFLDGVEKKHVIQADTSKGYIIEHYQLPSGAFAMAAGDLAIRRVEGVVTLVIDGDV